MKRLRISIWYNYQSSIYSQVFSYFLKKLSHFFKKAQQKKGYLKRKKRFSQKKRFSTFLKIKKKKKKCFSSNPNFCPLLISYRSCLHLIIWFGRMRKLFLYLLTKNSMLHIEKKQYVEKKECSLKLTSPHCVTNFQTRGIQLLRRQEVSW